MSSRRMRGARRASALFFALTTLFFLPVSAFADEAPPSDAEPPPLPLNTYDGNGGAFVTMSAYLINPGPPGEPLGMPAVGFIHVHLGSGKSLDSFTLNETLFGRVELGYAFSYLDIGDLGEDVERAFDDLVTVSEQHVELHTFNARFQVLREGDFGCPWLPTLTFGVHYKKNGTLDKLDRDLGGGLGDLGIDDDDGMDYSVVASRFVDSLPLPFAVSIGLRSTEAAHTGLFGFTGERHCLLEGNVCVGVLPWLHLAFEYRSKRSSYKEVPRIFGAEDDWWTLDACAIVDPKLTISVGYGHFGLVLNHKANRVFGLALKYEF